MSSSEERSNSREPLVSIILVTCNSAESLAGALPALASEIARCGFPCEMIVCDNASRDSSVELVREMFRESVIVSQGRNLGFAAGCNRAAERARGDLLLFLNPDVILDSGALTELVNAHSRLPDVGAVAGRMRNPDGSFQPTCREFPTALNLFGSRGSALGKLFSFLSYTLPDYSEITAVPAAAGTCLLLQREFFERLGGFDERFFMYMEDTDLCFRIAEAQKRVYFLPNAGGVHSWGAGSRASRRERERWHSESVLLYFKKHHPGVFSSLFLPLLLGANRALRRMFT